MEESQFIHMAVNEGITIGELGAVKSALRIFSFMFTPSFDTNVTITQIVNTTSFLSFGIFVQMLVKWITYKYHVSLVRPP